MAKLRTLLSLCLILTISCSQFSCTVWHTAPFVRHEPRPLTQEIRDYYSYPKTELAAVVVKEEEQKKYLFRQVEIPLSLPPEMELKPRAEWERQVIDIKKTNEKEARDLSLHYTNRLDLYLPKKPGKHPVILISPILGGNMIVDVFAKYFAKHGYVAVIVHRKKTFWDDSRDMNQLELYLRTSVIRIRQAIDWIETQEFADANRIGGFGISYGAILHSVLAAIEPRVKFHILAMPGGPLYDVIVSCPDPNIKKLRKRLYKSGWTKQKFYEELKDKIKTDPIKLAPYVPKDRVLVMAALFDRVVGFTRTMKLWNRMDHPKLKVIPLGHYGGILVFPYLEWVALSNFKSKLT